MMKPGIYLEMEQLSGAPMPVRDWLHGILFGDSAPAPAPASAPTPTPAVEEQSPTPDENPKDEDPAAKKRSERAKKAAETRRKNAAAKKAAEKAAEETQEEGDSPVAEANPVDSGASGDSKNDENDLLGGGDTHPVDLLSDDDLPGPAELVDMCRTYMAANGADKVKVALAGVGAKKVSDCESPEQVRGLIKELGLTVER